MLIQLSSAVSMSLRWTPCDSLWPCCHLHCPAIELIFSSDFQRRLVWSPHHWQPSMVHHLSTSWTATELEPISCRYSSLPSHRVKHRFWAMVAPLWRSLTNFRDCCYRLRNNSNTFKSRNRCETQRLLWQSDQTPICTGNRSSMKSK